MSSQKTQFGSQTALFNVAVSVSVLIVPSANLINAVSILQGYIGHHPKTACGLANSIASTKIRPVPDLLELPHTQGCMVCGPANALGLHLSLFVDPATGIVHVDFSP